jgi:chloramphenicol 3-O-phosphotransferase
MIAGSVKWTREQDDRRNNPLLHLQVDARLWGLPRPLCDGQEGKAYVTASSGDIQNAFAFTSTSPLRAHNMAHRHVSIFTSTQELFGKSWGFHGGDYEECRLLGCGAV